MNNYQQQQQQQQAMEVLTTQTEMAKLVNRYNKNAWKEWLKAGCKREDIETGTARLIMPGDDAEANNDLVNSVLDVLLLVEKNHPNTKFKLSMSILLPEQKCGYVIGREGNTIKKIQADNEVRCYIDGGRDSKIKEGFSRVVIECNHVEPIRAARTEIHRLISQSLPFNPCGPADGRKKLAEKLFTEGNSIRERIKLPKWDKFNAEERERFREIQRTSGINWEFDKNHSTGDERLVTLEGEWEKIVLAKKRISHLIIEIGSAPTNRFDSSNLHVELVVPTPYWHTIIGKNGEGIRALQAKFGVKMRFMGDNYANYEEGRTLRITGGEEQVGTAAEYIKKEYLGGGGSPRSVPPLAKDVRGKGNLGEEVEQLDDWVPSESGLSSDIEKDLQQDSIGVLGNNVNVGREGALELGKSPPGWTLSSLSLTSEEDDNNVLNGKLMGGLAEKSSAKLEQKCAEEKEPVENGTAPHSEEENGLEKGGKEGDETFSVESADSLRTRFRVAQMQQAEQFRAMQERQAKLLEETLAQKESLYRELAEAQEKVRKAEEEKLQLKQEISQLLKLNACK